MSLKRELGDYGFREIGRCSMAGARHSGQCSCTVLLGPEGEESAVVRTHAASFYHGPGSLDGKTGQLGSADGFCGETIWFADLPEWLSAETSFYRIDAHNRALIKRHYKHGF